MLTTDPMLSLPLRPSRTLALPLACLLSFAGCGTGNMPDDDAGSADAAMTDAGPTPDTGAGGDAGIDAQVVADGGPVDGGPGSDGGPDAGECDGEGTSRGMLGDERLDRIAEGVTRVYYAGADAETSQRCNAVRDAQVLYYDVYPAPEAPIGATAIYIHGGGYNVGYANNGSISEACAQLIAEGLHCVAVEYRRGFVAGGDLSVTEVDLTPEDSAAFRVILEMARQDVVDAWDHLHADRALGLPPRYVVLGESAGGSLASRVTLTDPGLDKDVLGVVVGFGTHEDTEPVVSHDFPVVIQGGLFDHISPAYSAPIWFDDDMPTAKGLFELRDELLGLGVPTRMYLNAHQGHGFGSYEDEAGTIVHYPEAIAFFREVQAGGTPENFTEWQFEFDDCDQEPVVRAGDRLRTPGFRYDPRQADFEEGLTPDAVRERRGRPARCD